MQDQYSRTQLLLGKEAMETLHHSRVAVFGIGGVGGYTVEALARSGVGALDLIDDDKVCLTNLNRQIVATRKTVGQYKVDVAEQRIHEIDPNIKVTTYKTFFTPETQDQFDFTQYDYVVDAIDTVTGKIALVVKAKEAGTPIICAMGAGDGYLQNFRLPAGQGHAHRVPQAEDQAPEGRLLQGACHDAHRGRFHQLQESLHLPAGHPAQVYHPPLRPRLQCLCAVGRRPHHRRRGRQGPRRLRASEGVSRN